MLVSYVRVQEESSGPLGLCEPHLKLQEENFQKGNVGEYMFPRRLCVRTMARSAREYWIADDKQLYITGVKIYELDSVEKAKTACPTDYVPVVHDMLDFGYKYVVARMYLTEERLYVICYAKSMLTVDPNGNRQGQQRVPSGNFLKTIMFELSFDPANRITLGYNKADLDLWPNTTFTDNQINVW